MIRGSDWALKSRPNRCLQPAKPDNRHFRDYPLTGHAAGMSKSTRMTPNRTSTTTKDISLDCPQRLPSVLFKFARHLHFPHDPARVIHNADAGLLDQYVQPSTS